MSLLSFNENYRRSWMFPRNIRDIRPWKIYQILTVLMKCKDLDMTNKVDQRFMYDLLEEVGVKGKANTRDKNPGGMRTYFAQLKCLGLVYEDTSKQFHYTIAGENIAKENNPLKVMQVQLLRHQYPSAYGHSSQVAIDPRLKVKPFLFLLRLFNDERLKGYLTCDEIIVPVLYGHNDDCYELCVKKILQLRDMNGILVSIINNFEEDLYTKRSGYGKDIGNIRDIANTAKNYLEACSLIIPADVKINGKMAYMFNSSYKALYEEMLEENDIYLPYDNQESFQRAYGRYDKNKDTRNIRDTELIQESQETTFVKFKYVMYANDNLFYDDDHTFIDDMRNMGIDASIVAEAIAPYKVKRRSLDETNFIQFANSGGVQSEEFEKALTNIFKKIGFTESLWIGRKKAYNDRRGAFPDVFIKKSNSKEVGFAEAKASSNYSLGHADMLKMSETYSKCNKELDEDSELKFFLYCAGGFKGEINKSLKELKDKTHITVTALDAPAILKLLELYNQGWTTEDIKERILKRGEYLSEYDL